MMCILTISRWSQVTICCLAMTIAFPVIADQAIWTPRLGPITTVQATDIRLISQKIELADLEKLLLRYREAWAFEAEAEFALFNTSRSKKKPTILVSICTLNERFDPSESCALSQMNLVVKVDGQEVAWSPFAKSGQVFARFPLKFKPRSGRKVVVSHLLFERNAGNALASSDTYLTFDYHLEDSAAWNGTVGATYFSAKLPFKPDRYNVKMTSAGKRFLFKNRLAYFIGKKMNLDGDDGLSFYVTTSSFRHKTERFRRQVNAIPHSVKRRLALASVLSAFPGAENELRKHVDYALRRRLNDRPEAEIDNASELYSKFLLSIGRFNETDTPCGRKICVEKEPITRIIESVCTSNKCKETNSTALAACCAPVDSPESRNYVRGSNIDALTSDTEGDADTDDGGALAPDGRKSGVDHGDAVAAFMLRYAFLLFMAALGAIGLTAWIVVTVKGRNKKERYSKTLSDY